MPYEITQCYLPPGRGDFPAFTPAEAGTRFNDPGGMPYSNCPYSMPGCRRVLGRLFQTRGPVTQKLLSPN